MKAEDIGINPETGTHSAACTEAEASMLQIMADHIGKDEKISANQLAYNYHTMTAEEGHVFLLAAAKREVRYMVNHLIIDHDHPIMSKAGVKGGYWIAANKREVDEFYESFRRRALTGFTKAARGKKAVMISMVKQLAFDWEELKAGERPALVRPYEDRESAPLAVVTGFLDKMTKEPEKFEHEIRMLRDKFGKVLMPKEDFGKIQALSRQLTEVLARVG